MITYNIRHLQHCDKSTNERINFLRKISLYHFLKIIKFVATFYLTYIYRKVSISCEISMMIEKFKDNNNRKDKKQKR